MGRTTTEREVYLRTRARCFNEAWEYLEKRRRTALDNRRMLGLAHTARTLATIVGTPRNHAIGDWQISRVYAALGEGRLSLLFAKSSLDVCEENHLSDLVCTAHEAIARAFVVGKDLESAREHLARARKLLDGARVDAEDHEIFLGQIRETEALLRRARRSP